MVRTLWCSTYDPTGVIPGAGWQTAAKHSDRLSVHTHRHNSSGERFIRCLYQPRRCSWSKDRRVTPPTRRFDRCDWPLTTPCFWFTRDLGGNLQLPPTRRPGDSHGQGCGLTRTLPHNGRRLARQRLRIGTLWGKLSRPIDKRFSPRKVRPAASHSSSSKESSLMSERRAPGRVYTISEGRPSVICGQRRVWTNGGLEWKTGASPILTLPTSTFSILSSSHPPPLVSNICFLISFSLSLSFPFNPSLCYRLVVTRYISKTQFFAALDNYWTYLLPVSWWVRHAYR